MLNVTRKTKNRADTIENVEVKNIKRAFVLARQFINPYLPAKIIREKGIVTINQINAVTITIKKA